MQIENAEPPTQDPDSQDQKPQDPEPVTVEPQQAKNPVEERMERLENGLNTLIAKQDDRDKRERASGRAEKFKARKDSQRRSVQKQDKENEGGGDSRSEGNPRGIQSKDSGKPPKRTRFRFRHKSSPAGK